MYTLEELDKILGHIHTYYEIQKFSGIILEYRKTWSIIELQWISLKVNHKLNFL